MNWTSSAWALRVYTEHIFSKFWEYTQNIWRACSLHMALGDCLHLFKKAAPRECTLLKKFQWYDPCTYISAPSNVGILETYMYAVNTHNSSIFFFITLKNKKCHSDESCICIYIHYNYLQLCDVVQTPEDPFLQNFNLLIVYSPAPAICFILCFGVLLCTEHSCHSKCTGIFHCQYHLWWFIV